MKKIFKYLAFLCLLVILQVNGTIAVKADEKVPMLTGVTQLNNNQLQITYDKVPDKAKATNPSNYWVQSLKDKKPRGIASLGKDDQVSSNNSLTSNQVTITMAQNNPSQYILTFKDNIKSGAEYKLIICYITVPDGGDYTGDNGSANFIGK